MWLLNLFLFLSNISLHFVLLLKFVEDFASCLFVACASESSLISSVLIHFLVTFFAKDMGTLLRRICFFCIMKAAAISPIAFLYA